MKNKQKYHTVLQERPCASAMLKYFGIAKGTTWNNRTKKNVWPDTLRRNGYSVRSRMSQLKKGASVGGIRKCLARIANNEPAILAFVVRVRGHVLVLDLNGRTIIDTAPRKADRRKVVGVFAVMYKDWDTTTGVFVCADD